MKEKHTLWVHVGIPRTGSSFLQKYLATDAKEILADNGFCYPDTTGAFNDERVPEYGRYGNGVAEFFTRGFILGENGWKQRFDNLLYTIDECIITKDVIISDERIWLCSDDYLNFLKNRYENVKVIILLRRQDKRIESGWSQLVYSVSNYYMQLDEACMKLFDENSGVAADNTYYQNLRRIEGIIGKENLIISTYEEASKIGLNTWFMHALGIEGIPKRKNELLNASHDPYRTEIRRILNKRFSMFYVYSDALDKAYRRCEMQKGKKGSLLSPNDRRRILNHFEEDNRMVAKKYFDRDQLFSDEVDYPQITLNEEEIKDRYIEVLEKMIIHMSYKISYPSLTSIIDAGKKIAFFGAGFMGRRCVEYFHLPAEIIIDNDIEKKGQIIGGIPVVWAGDFNDWKEYFFLITPLDTSSIEKQLEDIGLKIDMDFINIHKLELW